MGPIDDEFEELPYVNDQLKADTSSRLDDGALISVVYIEDFFTDGRDFAYYITGRPNVTAFSQGIFGMQAYNGPLTATPMMSYNSEILNSDHVRDVSGGKVQRSHSHMETVKWKYLFETARLAWSKLRIDPSKLKRVRNRNANVLSYRKQIGQDRSADWEVHSVASTGAKEFNVGKNERKRDDRSVASVEEPSTPAVEPADATSEPEDALIRGLFEKDMAEECLRINFILGAIEKKGGSRKDFVDCLTKCTRLLDGNEDVQAERRDLIERLSDAMELKMDLEVQEKKSDGIDTAVLLDIGTQLEWDIEDLVWQCAVLSRNHRSHELSHPKPSPNSPDLGDDKTASIDQIVSIVNYSKERALHLLATNCWDVETAVAAHFDSVKSAAGSAAENTEEAGHLAHAILASSHGLPKDNSVPRTLSATSVAGFKSSSGNPRLSHVSKSSSHTAAGPSGTKKSPKLDDMEEETKLAADRERLAQLILKSDKDVDDVPSVTSDDVRSVITLNLELATMKTCIDRLPEYKRQKDLEELARQANWSVFTKPEVANKDVSDDGSDRKSEGFRDLAKKGETHSTVPAKRPSFQTALDVTNTSPTKRSRHGSGGNATNALKETNQVSFVRDGTPVFEESRTADGGSTTLSTPTHPLPNPDFILEPPSPTSYKQSPQQGKAQGSNQGTASTGTVLGDDMDLVSKLAVLRVVSSAGEKRNHTVLFEQNGNLERAIHALRAEGNAWTITTPEPDTGLDGKLNGLREMGFLNEEQNIKVLKMFSGNLEMAMAALLGSDDTSPRLLPEALEPEDGSDAETQQALAISLECVHGSNGKETEDHDTLGCEDNTAVRLLGQNSQSTLRSSMPALYDTPELLETISPRLLEKGSSSTSKGKGEQPELVVLTDLDDEALAQLLQQSTWSTPKGKESIRHNVRDPSSEQPQVVGTESSSPKPKGKSKALQHRRKMKVQTNISTALQNARQERVKQPRSLTINMDSYTQPSGVRAVSTSKGKQIQRPSMSKFDADISTAIQRSLEDKYKGKGKEPQSPHHDADKGKDEQSTSELAARIEDVVQQVEPEAGLGLAGLGVLEMFREEWKRELEKKRRDSAMGGGTKDECGVVAEEDEREKEVKWFSKDEWVEGEDVKMDIEQLVQDKEEAKEVVDPEELPTAAGREVTVTQREVEGEKSDGDMG